MSHAITEEKKRQHLSFIQQNHVKLSAFAREQYAESGRGLLLVAFEPNGQCAIGYVGPKSVEGDAPRMVAAYNPEVAYLLAISEPNIPTAIYHFKLAANAPQKEVAAEPVFNLFVYVINDVISHVGAVRHYFAGTDAEKTSFLQSRVKADLPAAKRYQIPKSFIILDAMGKRCTGISYGTYLQLMHANKHLVLFEHAFRDLRASKTPLYCITPVVNGVPQVDVVMRL